MQCYHSIHKSQRLKEAPEWLAGLAGLAYFWCGIAGLGLIFGGIAGLAKANAGCVIDTFSSRDCGINIFFLRDCGIDVFSCVFAGYEWSLCRDCKLHLFAQLHVYLEACGNQVVFIGGFRIPLYFWIPQHLSDS